MLSKRIANDNIRNITEWVLAVVFSLAVYFILTNYVYSAAEVSGHSMSPTFEHGERVIVNRMAYWFGSPKRGDIIAFPYPSNPEENYIKRVIGIPGDEIDIFSGKVYINGEEFADYQASGEMIPSGDVVFPIFVGEGEYFVLGDNRNNSKDSRYSTVGCLRENDIIGKVNIRFWPADRIGAVN